MLSVAAVHTRAVLATLLFSLPLVGQPVRIDTARAAVLYPYNANYEEAFQAGLSAWVDGQYEDAYDQFRLIIEAPENRRTTAAMLMGGRSLLAAGRYAESVGLLTALVRRYPESRYHESALKLRDAAQERYNLRLEAEREVFQIGVLLPMASGALRFTRSAFEGIRMAVDEFNGRGGRGARLVFEDSGADPSRARRAARRLIDRANPDVIIGPLFSEEAVAVAAVTEEAGIPLLVPLATDDAVTEDRTLVFQANPTYEMRGRLMARRVVRNMEFSRLGVIADSTSFAGRMAQGFIDEAAALGAAIRIIGWLENLRDWYVLPDRFHADTLTRVDGLYIPVTGDDARGVINIALTGLARTDPTIPLFGNGEWADYPDATLMAQHEALYAVDFLVDSTRAEVVQFDQEFRRRMGQAPDKPAFVGYDVTRFLLQYAREFNESISLSDAFRSGVSYQGLGVNLYFGSGQVNQSLFFLSYGENGVTRSD
jgi:ABC-type branched-subunit amino acid transport system substrate-binding protein